jgi:hypothetical protein
MKKSLCSIMALAMTFSTLCSIAYGAETETTADAVKTSADFSDLKDLDAGQKARFDEMISAGIFDGVAEGKFGLKEEMNRAQFAKVAAHIFKLKVDASLKTSSFKDVKADDPANGYALPYIEAVKAAGITDGVAEGTYDPAGKVTKEQLAAFLIKGLGLEKDAKANPGLTDDTVSDWAKGYVALAIQKKLLTNGTDGKFGGAAYATRDLLVLSSSAVKEQFKSVPFNGKYAIASFKATDANVLTLELNGALTAEAEKALKIELKKDGNAIASGYTTTWDKDKKAATLKFNAKFLENKFDVTISGVTNIDDSAKTASLTTTKERITKIEWLTASDTLPLAVYKDSDGVEKAHKIRIDFKATNQYGMKASLSASSFDIKSNDGSVTPISGEQALYLTQEDEQERNDRISITILHEDSVVQVNKVFTVGDEPIVSKVEVGDLISSSGAKLAALEAKGSAYLAVKAYDQYGLRVEEKQLLNEGINVTVSDSDVEFGEDDRDGFVDNIILDEAADLKLRSVENVEKEVTVSLYARDGQAVSKKIKINAAKIPASVEFGAYNYQLAEGDIPADDDTVDKKFHIPLIVKDSAGKTLSADEISDAYKQGKFDIDSTGGIELADDPIAVSGAYKGMIIIDKADNKGSQSITVALDDLPDAKAQLNLSVGDEREAAEIRFSTVPKTYMINSSNNEMIFKVYDQYGTELKYDNKAAVTSSTYGVASDYMIRLNWLNNAGTGTTFSSNENLKTLTHPDTWTYMIQNPGTSTAATRWTDGEGKPIDEAGNRLTAQGGSVIKEITFANKVGEATYRDFGFANGSTQFPIVGESIRVFTNGNPGKGIVKVKAQLLKKNNNGSIDGGDFNYSEVDDLSATIEILDKTDSNNKLIYEAFVDRYNGSLLAFDDFADTGKGPAAAKAAKTIYQKLVREVKVRVKTANGDVVKNNQTADIVSVTSDNPNVAEIVDKRFVVGMEAGKAKLSILYKDSSGEIQNQIIEVVSKNEAPTVKSIALLRYAKTVDHAASVDGMYVYDELLAEKMTVVDSYNSSMVNAKSLGARGDAFLVDRTFVGTDRLPNGQLVQSLLDATNDKNGVLGMPDDPKFVTTLHFGQQANDVQKLTFYISDIDYADPDAAAKDSVKVDAATGLIHYTSTTGTYIKAFKVNIIAPNGVTKSFAVSAKAK